MTDCSNSGVMHSFFVRIAASAARDSGSLMCPVIPLVALMIALTLALLAEIRDAWRSGNCRSNPAGKRRKSSFSCQRCSSKPGKRLAIWASDCIAANASRVPSTTIAHLSWLDKNFSRFSAARCSCAEPASRLHLVDDGHARCHLAQQHQRRVLHSGQPVAGAVGRVQCHEQLPKEAPFLRRRTHVDDKYVDL